MFTGSGFYVAAASQPTPGTVRVSYSSVPKASSALGANDALNPANYALSGPGPATISSVQAVSGNPLSFDLVLTSTLLIGTWTVTVSNVQTPASAALVAPFSAQFQVTAAATLTPLAGGATNDDAETVIRKHLDPALKGPNWDALIAAVSTGDTENWNTARSAFDQLFISTASGLYLERRAADEGIREPLNVGISDDLFRQYTIKTRSKKLVHEAIREILEVFYGRDSLRAYVECSVDETYNLSGDLELTWILDEKESFSHTFISSEFGAVGAGRAVEIAFALTKTMRDLGSRGFAVAHRSPDTGLNRVRIYSGSLGLGSFVRVTGGSAQNVLKFPTEISTYSGTITTGTGYSWVYSQPDSNTTRISLTINTGTTATLIDLSGVREGDYVVIGTDAQTGVTGTYSIKAVGISWAGANFTQTFDIERISFASSAIQASNSAYRFYRPTKNSIVAAGGRTVIVAQTGSGSVDIQIPATTQAVSRGPKQAAYLRQQTPLEVSRLQRLPSGIATVTTVAGHGYTSGDIGKQVFLDGIVPAPSRPFITPGNSAAYPSSFTYPAAHIAINADTQAPPSLPTENGTATLLTNGQLLFAGGYRTVAGVHDGAKTLTNRYVAGSTSTITDGTEADAATQHSHTWLSTTALNAARQYHAASTFGNLALVSGGMTLSPFTILSSAERYALGGAWTTLTSMATARAGHQQVDMMNGTVMVAGGAITEGTATRTAEIFNGLTWSSTGSMLVPRTDFQLVRLSDGRVMAIGGRTLGRGHDSDAHTLAHYKLDETAGPTAADSTGTYPLTYTGVPAVTAQGKINNALNLSAAGAYLTGAGDAAARNALQSEWTIELWFKRSATTATELVVYAGATEVSNDNTQLKLGITNGANGNLYVKWERAAGTDVVTTMVTPLASLASYRASFFNHLAVVKSLNALTYSAKVSGWAVGDLIHGMSSGAKARVVSVDGGAPGAAAGTVRIATENHLPFSAGENLVIIPINNPAIDVTYLSTAAVAGQNLYNLDFYVNGYLYESFPSLDNASGGLAASWYVGFDPKIPGSGCPGTIDDIRVSKRARTAGQIQESYLHGWGNHQSPHGDIAIGDVSAEVEIYSGGTWTRTGQMAMGRAFHRAIVLPGDYVLVLGGLGYDTTRFPARLDTDTSIWPSESLASAEIWSPVTGTWSTLAQAGVRRHGFVAALSGTSVIVQGGKSSLLNGFAADDVTSVEVLDLNSRTWRQSPSKATSGKYPVCGGLVGSTVVVTMGGNNGTITNANAEAYIPGGLAVSSGGLNRQHRIIGVPDGNRLQVQTTDVTDHQHYTSTHGAAYQGQAVTSGYWSISTGSRTSNLTTLVLSFPSGISAHSIVAGDYVYVNSRTGAFGAGLKLVTAVTTTSISYAETASNQGSIAVTGSVSENYSSGATAIQAAAPTGSVNDPGPILFDPDAGLAVTSTESLTSTYALEANQQYEELEVADGSGFSADGGYIMLGFGHSNQTAPIKYLSKYKSGSTTKLILDYGYRFVNSFPIGSTVTLLSQKEPFNPETPEALGAFYLTASSAGRVAAQKAAEEALAAGVNPEITIVYPGDRGLGGEGLPATGVQKLSDKVGVFAGDDVDAEIQSRRDE